MLPLSLPSLSLSPSAVSTPLAGQRLYHCLLLLRWLWTGVCVEGGLPGLLVNSSLNSQLGMQDGPTRSWSAASFTGALALAQEPSWGELFLPLLVTQMLLRQVFSGAGGVKEGVLGFN